MKKYIKHEGVKDYTRQIREAFVSLSDGTLGNLSELIFEGGKSYCVDGMLDEDRVHDKWSTIWEYGIIRIEGRKHIKLKTDNEEPAIFYTTKPGIPNDTKNNDGATINSHRSTFKIINSTGIKFENIHGLSINLTEERPVLNASHEFEHIFHVEGSQDITFRNCEGVGALGDTFYLGNAGGKPIEEQNWNIKFYDCIADSNGRQGFAFSEAHNCQIIRCKVLNSGRGGIDFEPPWDGCIVDGVIIKDSSFRTHLLAFPMGGNGTVRNILVKNNEYSTGRPTTYVKSGSKNGLRENIIFTGNKRLNSYGSSYESAYRFKANNLLIENEINSLNKNRSGWVANFNDSKNVTYRNNYCKNGEFIRIKESSINDVKFYNNKQKLEFLLEDKTVLPIEEYVPTEKEANSIPFDVPEFIANEYYGITEELEEDIEPELTEPETPVEEPDDPPQKDEPPVTEQPNKWYKNKLLWVIGGIAVIILLALML